jgi:hypothetical protein
MSEELWRVQLGTGEVRAMTLDGLDRAFEEGLIDARANVLAPGTTAWTTLGAVAGLDDEHVRDDQAALQDPTPSLSPVALSTSTPSLPPSSFNLDDRHRGLGLGLGLGLDLDDDALAMTMKPKRRGLLVAGIVTAVAAAAAITLAITKLGPPAEQATLKAAAAAAQAPAAATDLPPAATDNKSQLNEEQKKRLLEADKARDEKARKAAQERAEKADKVQKRTKTKSGPVFVNGGDKFDPLNGAL